MVPKFYVSILMMALVFIRYFLYDQAVDFRPSKAAPQSIYVEARNSSIHGYGLFAKVVIPKGTIWFVANSTNSVTFNRKQYSDIAQRAQHSHASLIYLKHIHTYAYCEIKHEILVLSTDLARFVNSSPFPNSGFDADHTAFQSVALRDIMPGEEVLEDYGLYGGSCNKWATTCADFNDSKVM
jgi:SET domain-containing protein